MKHMRLDSMKQKVRPSYYNRKTKRLWQEMSCRNLNILREEQQCLLPVSL